MDTYVTFAHAQSIMPDEVMITHLTDFSFGQDCNTESKGLEAICSEWSHGTTSI
jgi:hypothetical protein